MISEAWGKNCQGSSPFILSETINNTKNALKLWSKTHFGQIEENLKIVTDDLSTIRQKQPTHENRIEEGKLN